MSHPASPLALLKDPSLLKTDALVGGRWVPGAARFAVHDPATGLELAQVANLGPAEAEAAVAAAANFEGRKNFTAEPTGLVVLAEWSITPFGGFAQQLLPLAREFDTVDEFLEQISLVADTDELDDDTSSVVLMTLHSAKGLEFPYVFLPFVSEQAFPGGRGRPAWTIVTVPTSSPWRSATRICDWRKISTTPMYETRTVSFCSPMKSLSSGGMMRRIACGTE